MNLATHEIRTTSPAPGVVLACDLHAEVIAMMASQIGLADQLSVAPAPKDTPCQNCASNAERAKMRKT